MEKPRRKIWTNTERGEASKSFILFFLVSKAEHEQGKEKTQEKTLFAVPLYPELLWNLQPSSCRNPPYEKGIKSSSRIWQLMIIVNFYVILFDL